MMSSDSGVINVPVDARMVCTQTDRHNDELKEKYKAWTCLRFSDHTRHLSATMCSGADQAWTCH